MYTDLLVLHKRASQSTPLGGVLSPEGSSSKHCSIFVLRYRIA